MQRWLTISAAVGLFATGVVAGSWLEIRAHAEMYRTMCVSLFTEHGSDALFTMGLLAQGHAESVYDLAEGTALLCTAQLKSEHSTPEIRKCVADLKAFYDVYPERKANLERRHPQEAQRLGYGASP